MRDMVLVQININNNYHNSWLIIKTISEINFEHNFEMLISEILSKSFPTLNPYMFPKIYFRK